VTYRTAPKKGKKEGRKVERRKYCHGLIPGDVTFIPSLERLVTPSRISGSTGLGSMKVKTRGMQEAGAKKTP
jgi:hypothetical protein